MMKRLHHDIFAGAMILILSLFFLIQTSDLPERAALYPYLILFFFIFFSILLIINGFRKSNLSKSGREVQRGDDEERLTFSMIKWPAAVLLCITIYIVIMALLGFFISSSIFMIGILYLLKLRSIKTYFLTVSLTLVFVYVLFVQLLNVSLPMGLFF